jgi:lysophospholipase L1-like esterase
MKRWALLTLALAACRSPEPSTFLIGIGDSVTAGFGATEGKSYFELLAADLRGRISGLQIQNLSVSGSISIEHLDRQIPKVPRGAVGIVVMTTGGNDLIHDYGRSPSREGAMYGATLEQARPWIEAFERRLETMIERISERFSTSHIFIADIYDPTDGVGDIEKAGLPRWKDGIKILAEYNSVIARVGAKHPNVHVIEVYKTFLGHGLHGSDYWYYENLEDPNDKGYAAMYKLFRAEIERVLKD